MSFALDDIAIYDSDFGQVFRSARPLKGSISEPSKLMEHPLETGAVVVDHRIVLPTEVVVAMVLDADNYRQTYQRIRQAYRDGTQYTVQMRAGGYKNMVIADMPHEENVDMFDTIPLTLKFREVQFVTAQFVKLPAAKVKNKKQQSTKARGQQVSKAPNQAQAAKSTSLLARIFK